MNRRDLLARVALGCALASLALAIAGACAPGLPEPSGGAPGADAAAEAGASVELEPAAALDAAPRALRIRVTPPPGEGEIDPARFVLVAGEMGPAHLRQLEREEISAALSERLVPALTWAEGEAVVVAPAVPLAAGEVYTVASGEPPLMVELRVAEDDAAAWLERIWPPPDGGAAPAVGVWCGEDPLPAIDLAARLDPLGPEGAIRRGAIADGAGARCARFVAGAPVGGDGGAGPWVGPPAIELQGGALLLDPRPFRREVEPPAVAPLACDAGELAIGPGCARVEDDRIAARSPEAPLLWSASGAGLDVVLATGAGDPFLIAPLAPSTAIRLAITTIDAAGVVRASVLSAITAPPRAHLVLNEVMANPLGPEPHQEWIEIVNDGQADADLAGYVLTDIGGVTPLPAGVLPAGAYALLVNEGFVEDDEIDPPAVPGALLLRVPELGKDGLTNAGEPIKLRDPDGAVVSALPPLPKPKAGLSLARVAPKSPDGLATSFRIADPATPGAANTVENP